MDFTDWAVCVTLAVLLKTLIIGIVTGAVSNLFDYGYSMGRRFRKKSSTIPFNYTISDVSHDYVAKRLFLLK